MVRKHTNIIPNVAELMPRRIDAIYIWNIVVSTIVEIHKQAICFTGIGPKSPCILSIWHVKERLINTNSYRYITTSSRRRQ